MRNTPKFDATLTALMDMRQFFSDQGNWIQGRSTDNDGRYCVLGYAVNYWHSYVGLYLDSLAMTEFSVEGPSEIGLLRPVAEFNDTCSHAELLAFLDRAIELRLSEAQGQAA